MAYALSAAFQLGIIFGVLVIGLALIIWERNEENDKEEETHDNKRDSESL